ncbi:MAG: hypothetical protein A2X05_05100 [Bacteroidetes bacterium GWE2_41_25]|nr:MAG: hypothetical protein A2X03_01695 [Bacteroidetes bacterium GWA2_40_15]OFX92276.1 MAG: hypothetical protein A2X05_05100 [Bacteroidetes bacterium GWE2_41_25]OFX99876.1 MAG: hypothetical protein A2X06_03020 [Bacteroidetes bacterium GWC2_40_22]OFY57037.1 MAG: hypothetical protein A2X04_16575 [Bacteroidetes bacterium GWF2_41_9]HAM10229.1 hypothetical protein [Bacteroidales bacterium]
MSFSDFTTYHGIKVPKVHYLHLIQVARADGKIDRQEMAILHKEGRRFGLTDAEIDNLIEKEKDHQYHPPYSLDDKFEDLFYIAEMMLADDVINDDELRLLRRFAIEVGFDDRAIEILEEVLIGGIRNMESEEELLKKFKTELFKNNG